MKLPWLLREYSFHKCWEVFNTIDMVTIQSAMILAISVEGVWKQCIFLVFFHWYYVIHEGGRSVSWSSESWFILIKSDLISHNCFNLMKIYKVITYQSIHKTKAISHPTGMFSYHTITGTNVSLTLIINHEGFEST